VIIGAANALYTDPDTSDTYSQAGAVYVYDRDVQRFIYGTDGSTTQFTVLGTVTAPVSVLVNNTFLVNEADAEPDAANAFTVNGNIINISNANLVVGDIIEIETNEFQLVQTINQNTVEAFSNYGYATDLCSYNCSLYAGAPNSSAQQLKSGVVERAPIKVVTTVSLHHSQPMPI
jgi:hypothetical protein